MTTRQKLSSTSIAILALLAFAAAPCRAQTGDAAPPRQEGRVYSNARHDEAERVFNVKTADSKPVPLSKAFRSWEQLTEGERGLFLRRQLDASQARLSVAEKQFRAGGEDGSAGAGKHLVFAPSRGPIPVGQWINYGGAPDWNREHLTQYAALKGN